MGDKYRKEIAALIARLPFEVDRDIEIQGRPPTMASSEFLTNKEQGDWAEEIVFNAINENSADYCAVKYGRGESLAAGDPGFEEFYASYQKELNTIGKRPDLLIFRRATLAAHTTQDDLTDDLICKALAAIEVRSSSFLAERYANFMKTRTQAAVSKCAELQRSILQAPYAELLRQKSPAVYDLIHRANENTFRDLDFRATTWSSSPDLRNLSGKLRELKDQIKVLHKRDYLSITPKLEDLALVSRWISRYGVRHFYLQVFFDKAYIIPFAEILTIAADSDKEGEVFSVEEDVKNQGKTTIKINVLVGKEILGRIDMPEHRSAMKELERGRLLFYVTFKGGRGYLDNDVFTNSVIKNA